MPGTESCSILNRMTGRLWQTLNQVRKNSFSENVLAPNILQRNFWNVLYGSTSAGWKIQNKFTLYQPPGLMRAKCCLSKRTIKS